jgi:cell division protein FtsB
LLDPANLMDFLNNHFYLGLGIGVVLGLIGIGFAVMRLWDTKGEVRRLKRHLADKLELEAEATNRLRQDLQELKQQNENLRIKVANLNQYPERRLQRELEIYARAERFMVTSSPGFPAVWEEAKRNAVVGLEQEETGSSLPKRVFNALLNRPSFKSSNSDHVDG